MDLVDELRVDEGKSRFCLEFACFNKTEHSEIIFNFLVFCIELTVDLEAVLELEFEVTKLVLHDLILLS